MSSGEVRVDEYFESEHLGNALAKLWSLNGLTHDLVDVAYMCPFTTERPADPGMTADGHVYSLDNITQWLINKDTSPNTNATLTHKRVMRLLPLKSVLEQFFTQSKVQRSSARTQFEANCSRACKEATWHSQMQTEMNKLDCYIKTCMQDLEAWVHHLEIIRGIKQSLHERMLGWRPIAATQIQAGWRSFIAKRRARAERFRRATILIQCNCRSFLAIRCVERERGRCAAKRVRSAIRSFNARLFLLQLLEQEYKATLQLLQTQQKKLGLFPIRRQEAELVQQAEDPIPYKLFVEDPNKTLSGTYLQVNGKKPNGMPLWKLNGQNRWVFCGPGGQWFVGDGGEETIGFKVNTGDAVSSQAHGGRMPDEICAGGWLYFDEKTQDWKAEKEFNITSELFTKARQEAEIIQKIEDPTPHELHVEDPNKTLSGTYLLVDGREPNGMPLWKHTGQKRWIFCGRGGQWFIGDVEEETGGFQADTGDAVSAQAHGGRMPDEICAGGWLCFNNRTQHWKEEKDFNITSELFTKERQEAEIVQKGEDPTPQELRVHDPNKILSGTYLLVDGNYPNGMPLWKHNGQNRWVFCGLGGQWFVGDEEEAQLGFKVDTGNAVSAQAHGGRMPDEICECGWMYFDERTHGWKIDEKFNITSELYTKERQEAELVRKDEDSAPRILFVEDPNETLSGTYLLVDGRESNGMPLWKHNGQSRWIFCGSGGQWFIGDEEEEKGGFQADTGDVVSAQSHGGRMPDEICAGGWLYFNRRMQGWKVEKNFNITSELYTRGRQEAELVQKDEDTIPQTLFVEDPNKILSGTYLLVDGREPNGMPLWKHNRQNRWVFCGGGGQWFIGDEDEEESDFTAETGNAVSTQAHGGRMPDEICAGGWLFFNEATQEWQHDQRFNITSELYTKERQEAELRYQ